VRDPAPPDLAELETVTLEDAEGATRHRSGSTDPRVGKLLGPYVVLSRLGEGGMGVVYVAYDPRLDRKVALKLVREQAGLEGSSPRAQARLLREARAAARLAHPNVVTVHDVGSVGDDVFLAMELVEGQTLREWLKTPRPWRSTLEILRQAGRGLAAAHAAGLVHRDFKPENVLVAASGRVVVTDFGLARPTPGGSPGPAAGPRPDETTDGDQTRAGLLVGTPPYMAPEQLRGAAAGAHADQFGFAVTLWEALFGQRPFAGGDVRALLAAMAAGPPPPPRQIPRRLARALARGLALRPEDRHTSMEAMLQALTPRASTAVRVAAVALAAMTLVAIVLASRAPMEDPRARLCGGAEALAAGAWGPATREAVRAAFAGSGAPYAAHTLATVERALDGYAGDWTAMRTEACEATRVRGEQSEALLDRRMRCLDRRLSGLAALAQLLETADGKLVEQSVIAAAQLPRLAGCADAEALFAAAPLPDDPALRQRIHELERELAETKALKDAGRFAAAHERARPALEAARTVAYAPLEAEWLFLLGTIEERLGQAAAAEETLYQARFAAEAAHADAVAAGAATVLVGVVGYKLGRPAEAPRLAEAAHAAIQRIGGDGELEGVLLHDLAIVADAQGRGDEALDLVRRSLAVRERHYGAESVQVARTLNTVCVVLTHLGRHDEALGPCQEAHQMFRRLVGDAHPHAAFSVSNMADILEAQGRPAEALAAYDEAIATLSAALGAAHYSVGISLSNRAGALLALGRAEEALDSADRALAILEAAVGRDHAFLIASLTQAGDASLSLGRPRAAAPLLERAVRLLDTIESPDRLQAGRTRFALARALIAAGGDRVRARRLAERARADFGLVPARAARPRASLEAWLAAR
jgi:eukaryotic-like serine/threonine-protein kinase